MTSTLMWRKSSKSAGNGACVEVAHSGDAVYVRHSRNPEGAWLRFSCVEWDAFRDGVANGEFDREDES